MPHAHDLVSQAVGLGVVVVVGLGASVIDWPGEELRFLLVQFLVVVVGPARTRSSSQAELYCCSHCLLSSQTKGVPDFGLEMGRDLTSLPHDSHCC